jgi:hypothetical protein
VPPGQVVVAVLAAAILVLHALLLAGWARLPCMRAVPLPGLLVYPGCAGG